MEEWGFPYPANISRTNRRGFSSQPVNHSNQYRIFNHLPVPLVEAVGEISTSKSRVTNQRNDVWRNATLFLPTQLIRPRWPPYFKTKGGCWEECALAAPVHQAPGSRCIHASEVLVPRFRLFWVHTGFELRVIHFGFRFCWINNDPQIPNRSSALFWAPDCRNMGPSFTGRKSVFLTQGNIYRDRFCIHLHTFCKIQNCLQATFVYNIGKRKLLIQPPCRRVTLVLSRVQNCLCFKSPVECFFCFVLFLFCFCLFVFFFLGGGGRGVEGGQWGRWLTIYSNFTG